MRTGYLIYAYPIRALLLLAASWIAAPWMPASSITSDLQTDHWEVRSKDGLVSVYGAPNGLLNDPPVVANLENRRQIFHWRLTSTQDPFPAPSLTALEPCAPF